jgi:hypothetical protein
MITRIIFFIDVDYVISTLTTSYNPTNKVYILDRNDSEQLSKFVIKRTTHGSWSSLVYFPLCKYYTLWFWSSLVCKLTLNKKHLRSGCYVCEHTLTLVVFPSQAFLLCFHFKYLYLVFAMLRIMYTFFLLWCFFPPLLQCTNFRINFFLMKMDVDYTNLQWYGKYK